MSIEDLTSTVIPRSDQLNADQLITGPMEVTVTKVILGSSEEQPVVVHYENDGGRPFKPSKTMRRVMILAWGADGRAWAGKSMRLYHDPAVKFGGSEVGGIRISHMSHIDKDIKVSLTATKGKKVLWDIKRMAAQQQQQQQQQQPVDHAAALTSAPSLDVLKGAFKAAYRSTTDEATKADFKAKYDTRMAELMKAEDQHQPTEGT
jgi:hypothetical protein